MDELKIITTYKSSKNNKKLLSFISNNLSRSIDNNVKYHFTVAENRDSDFYAKKGITTFPCVTFRGKQVSGADRVISFIQELLVKKISDKRDQPAGEMLTDFYKETLGDKKSMEQEGEESSVNSDDMGQGHMSKVQEELERRNLRTEHLKNLKNTIPNEQLPPSQRKTASSQSSQSTRKNNVTVDIPIGSAMKNLKPKSSQEAADDALMANFFANQETST